MSPMTPHHRLPLLAQRVLNTPLAIRPEKAEIIVAALAERFGLGSLSLPEGATALLAEADGRQGRRDDRPYLVQDGVAIVPVEGTLVAKTGWIAAWSGLTGYDFIRLCVLDALADDDVDAIVLQIDSPGGEVAGCFDLADMIYAARARKPIWAILDECAYSAAYALASACARITVPRTGGAGSIGVIAMLADLSRATDREGVTVNIIQYGAHKADGNPYQPLPAEARARFQAQIDDLGELFVRTVARNRGLSPDAVRATEAATFGAREARRLGLVDAIAAPDAAFADLLSRIGA